MMNSTPKMMFLLSIVFILISFFICNTNSSYLMEWDICNLVSDSFKLNILMEWDSMLYCFIIMFISSMVMEFSKDYMKFDKSKSRFWVLIILFILSMMLFIFIPNMLTLLIGWDGLGITSFLLIMYYGNSQSMSASMFTMLVNRLGDMFLLMAIVMSLNNMNWLPNQYCTLNMNLMIQSMGIMIAAMTKSAQLPYSSWLPMAMAAPTPVSALVHSSTLVTAGIFLLYRFNKLITYFYYLQLVLSLSGLLTMFIAALSAMYEKDMKKIIALSTLSQLGLMTFCLGLKMYNLAYLHMTIHAIFKALLFICAGLMISSNSHNQDMRLYGMYSLYKPWVTSSYFISMMAMIGLPFMTGYYSKHVIMQWSAMISMNVFIYLLLLISISLTSMYTMKLMLFINFPSTHKPLFIYTSPQSNFNFTWMMSMMSICMAPILQWSLSISTNEVQLMENFQSFFINFILFSSIVLIIMFTYKNTLIHKSCNTVDMFFYSLSFLSPLYTKFFTYQYLNLSFYLYKLLDQSWLEKLSSMSLFLNFSLYLNKPVFFSPQKFLLATIMLFYMLYMMYYSIMV